MKSRGRARRVLSVRAVYDAASRSARRRVADLRRWAPADVTLRVAALRRARPMVALGTCAPDVMLVLGDWQRCPVREIRGALRERGWRTRLVATWNARLPDGLGALVELYGDADGWILTDEAYWRAFGRMPGTRAIADGAPTSSDRNQAAAAAVTAEYVQALRDARRRRSTRRTRGPDLTREVTVFVTTVGAATFPACLDRLRQQDCSFALRVIERVAPMHVAFQRMIDDCRTPYYVQVDEDMLLHPYAVRTLYQTIRGASPETALAIADLYDPHARRCINGVKIFRHAIVRRYPLVALDRFETEQIERMLHDGYAVRRTRFGADPVDGRTLGLHGVQWTPQALYGRYLQLARRFRSHPMEWFLDVPELFLRRYLADPSFDNFLALQGILAGTLLAAHRGEGGPRDYRTYDRLPGFHRLRALFAELGAPVPATARLDCAQRQSRSRRAIAARTITTAVRSEVVSATGGSRGGSASG